MSSLPPVLTGSSISGTAGRMLIDLTFDQQIERGSGTIIITDGALQTVIDRSSGLPATRIVGATQTYQVPLSMVSIDGNTAEIAVSGLSAGHSYRVFILPGALQANGLAFAGVSNAARLAFVTPPAADTTPPALLQMSMDNNALSTAKSAVLTMTFSESVSIDPSALAGPNISISGLASNDGGISWRANVSASAGVDASIGSLSLDMQKVLDHANNKGAGASSVSYSVDTKAPTVSAVVLGGASPVLSPDASVTVTFSKKVDLLAAMSPVIVAPHATVTGLHTTDGGTTWVASLAPQSGTIATGNQLYVDLAQVRDLAGNAGAGIANAGATYIVDTQGPGFKDLSLNGRTLSQGQTVDVTIHLQQAIPGFDAAALKSPNATVENIHTTDDGHTWIATLRGSAGAAASNNTLSLDMGKLRDANGILGSGMIDTPGAYDVDTVAPTATLVLAGAKVSAQNSVTVTITFSEKIQSLDPAAIKAPNVALADLATTDGGRSWVAKLVPTTQGGTASGNSVTLDMGMVRDLAGNAGAGSINSSTTYGVDTQPPTAGAISLSDSHVTSTTGPTMTVRFSEAVSLDPAGFTLPHAKLNGLQSTDGGITWTGTVVADGSGNAIGNTVSLDLSKVKDLYGNAGNGAVASGNYDVQVTAPTATITLGGNQVTKQTVVNLTVVFSQAVKGLTAAAFSTQADIVVSGLTSSDGGTTWTGTLSTNANIHAVNNVFSLDLGKVQDVFGNVGSGTVSASSKYDIDTQPPAATLALSSAHLTPAAGATLTVTFNEAVKALDPSWFTTPHAQLSGLASSDNGVTWTGTLSAAAGADFSGNVVSLDMSKIADLAGNSGIGSSVTATSYDVTHPPAQGVTLALDRTALANGSTIAVTMHFNVAVSSLDLGAISAPNAAVTDLRSTDGGATWTVTLAPQSGAVVAPANALSINLGKVVDINGIPGSGTVQSANYAVDTTVASYVQSILLGQDKGPSMSDFVTNETMPSFGGVLSVAPGDKQHVELSIDGQLAGTVVVSGTSWAAGQLGKPLADGTHSVSVRVVDDAGHASTVVAKTLTIDTVAPHVTGTSIIGGTPTVPGTVDVSKPLTISFAEPMYWHAVPTYDGEIKQTVYRDIDNAVTLSDSLNNSYMVYIDQRNLSADGKTLTLPAGDLHLAAGLTYNVGLPQALTDLAGNLPDTAGFSFQVSGTFVDTTAPFALAAQVTNQMGEYGIGQVVQIAVRFNEAVQLKSGAAQPSLALNNGTHASYAGASFDNRTLYFEYKISTGDAQPSDNPYHWIGLKDASSLLGAVTDLAGNTLDASHIQFTGLTNPLSPIAGSGISIDATPPLALAAPLLDPASDSGVKGDFITNHPVLTGGNAEPNAVVSLYDVSNASPMYLGQAQADASGKWTITDLLHIDGSYKLAVTQKDGAGNESPMSGALALVLDTVAAGPNDIHVANSYSAINLISAIKTPTLTGTGMEAGATVTLYEGQTALGAGVANSSGAWSITTGALSEGTHSIWLTQTDIAGNVGFSPGFPLVIDLTAPAQLAAPVLDPGSDSGVLKDLITNVKQALLTGSGAAPNATIELYDSDILLGHTASDGSGNWQFKPNALSDGVHALTVRQLDAAGNASVKSPSLSLTIDQTAAALVALKLDAASDSGTSNSDGITNVPKPTLTGSGAEANATIQLFEGGTMLASTMADSAGHWSLTPSASLLDGAHTLSARQVDVAGNVGAMSMLSISIDTVAPATLGAPKLSAASDSGVSNSDGITNVAKPILTGSGAEANAKIELFDGSSVVGAATADALGNWQVLPTAALPDGAHALTVRQVDLAGNAGSMSAALNITIDTVAPTVAGFTKIVPIGSSFEIWFSEPVLHNGLSGNASVYDTVTGALFSPPLGNPDSWSDNVTRDGHATSVWHFMTGNPGWVEVTLTGVQDAAGNVAAIPLAHYEFSAPLAFYLQPQAIL